MHLLRHGRLPRDNDGAIEFWRIKDHLQNHFVCCHHWSDEKWKSSMAGGGEKKRFQYCSAFSGTTLYFRALQGHSGRSLMDPSSQDNVIIPDGKYICHVGCAINVHSIINSGLIPGGQNLSKRQTVFFLPVDPMDKEHKGPDTIDLEAPRLAQSMEDASKCGVLGRHQPCTEERIEVLSNTIERHHPLQYTPSLVMSEKVYASPHPPPKISLKHDWMKELGSEVARQPEEEVARQAKFPIKPTKSKPRS